MFDSVLTGNEVVGSYNLGLVCLSFVIAVVTSYTALDLALQYWRKLWNHQEDLDRRRRFFNGRWNLVNAFHCYAGLSITL